MALIPAYPGTRALRNIAVLCFALASFAPERGVFARVSTDEHETVQVPFSVAQLKARTFSLARSYFAQFQHPDSFVLYGARLATKGRWTPPEQIKARLPKPWGYGSRIADTALHCGHTLVALLDAHDAAKRRPCEEAET